MISGIAQDTELENYLLKKSVVVRFSTRGLGHMYNTNS